MNHRGLPLDTDSDSAYQEKQDHPEEQAEATQGEPSLDPTFRNLLPGVLFLWRHAHQLIREEVRDLAPWATLFSLG